MQYSIDCFNGVPNIKGYRKCRTVFTSHQLDVLQGVFEKSPFITRDTRRSLSRQLKLTEGTVKVWFQNSRMKVKRNEKTKGVHCQKESKDSAVDTT